MVKLLVAAQRHTVYTEFVLGSVYPISQAKKTTLHGPLHWKSVTYYCISPPPGLFHPYSTRNHIENLEFI